MIFVLCKADDYIIIQIHGKRKTGHVYVLLYDAKQERGKCKIVQRRNILHLLRATSPARISYFIRIQSLQTLYIETHYF
jgi:hypothetical protein